MPFVIGVLPLRTVFTYSCCATWLTRIVSLFLIVGSALEKMQFQG